MTSFALIFLGIAGAFHMLGILLNPREKTAKLFCYSLICMLISVMFIVLSNIIK